MIYLEFGAWDLEFTGQAEIPKTRTFCLWLARVRIVSEQETQMRLPWDRLGFILTSLNKFDDIKVFFVIYQREGQ